MTDDHGRHGDGPHGGHTASTPVADMMPPTGGPAPGGGIVTRRPIERAAPPATDHDVITDIIRQLLVAIGENPDREGLADTPARVARWWREFVEYHPGTTDTTFDVIQADQMVAVSGVRVWSLCEHHLLPFWCDLTIAYIADDRVLGLSKFGRIAHAHAHGLQVQERLVAGIADEVEAVTGTGDVAVIGQGEHLCMTMRGIKTPAMMHSSVLRGAFRENHAARTELFALVR